MITKVFFHQIDTSPPPPGFLSPAERSFGMPPAPKIPPRPPDGIPPPPPPPPLPPEGPLDTSENSKIWQLSLQLTAEFK